MTFKRDARASENLDVRLTFGRGPTFVRGRAFVLVRAAVASVVTAVAVYALTFTDILWQRVWWYAGIAGAWVWAITSSLVEEFRARRRDE